MLKMKEIKEKKWLLDFVFFFLIICKGKVGNYFIFSEELLGKDIGNSFISDENLEWKKKFIVS